MSDFYEGIECTFAGTETLTNPTYGWDAVYAVKYSTLNKALAVSTNPADPPPSWKKDGDIDVGGFDNHGQLTGAIVQSVQLIPGGSGDLLKWGIQVTAQKYENVDDYSQYSILSSFDFDLVIRTTLTFQEDPANRDLVHLQVDTTEGLADGTNQVEQLTLKTTGGLTLTSTQIDMIQRYLRDLVEKTILAKISPTDNASRISRLCNATPLSTVFTKTLPKDVNVPWLHPARFDYATADLPKDSANAVTDGILAILAATDKNKQNLSNQVLATAYPTNKDAAAALIISTDIITKGPFVDKFNEIATKTYTGKFVPLVDPNDPSGTKTYPGTLVNDTKIDLKYRIDSKSGEIMLLTPAGLANSTGVTYPATIPPQALIFRIADDKLTIDASEIRVELGAGSTMVLGMQMDYRLVVNSETNDIDITPTGTPTLTTHFANADDSDNGFLIQLASIVVSSILTETGLFLVDRFFAGYTTVSDKKFAGYQHDVLGALRQSEIEGRPVKVDIGLGRTLTVERTFQGEEHAQQPMRQGPAADFNPEYRKSLKLRDSLPEETHIELPVVEDIEGPNDTHTELLAGGGQQRGHITPQAVDNMRQIGAGNPRGTAQQGAQVNNPRRTVTNMPDGDGAMNAPRGNPNVPNGERFEDFHSGSVRTKAAWMIADVAYMIERDTSLRHELVRAADKIQPGMGARMVDVTNRANGVVNGRDVLTLLNGRPETQLVECMYAATIKSLNDWYKDGKITATEYFTIVQQYPQFTENPMVDVLVNPQTGRLTPEPPIQPRVGDDPPRRSDFMNRHRRPMTRIAMETQARFREDKKVAPLVLRQIETAERSAISGFEGQSLSGETEASIQIIGKIIKDAKYSPTVHFVGLGVYVLGLVAGYFIGYYANEIFKQSNGPTQDEKNAAAAKGTTLQRAIAKKPGELMFGNISFPLMQRYPSDDGAPDPAIPLPVNVLKCASINGALILGVGF